MSRPGQVQRSPRCAARGQWVLVLATQAPIAFAPSNPAQPKRHDAIDPTDDTIRRVIAAPSGAQPYTASMDSRG